MALIYHNGNWYGGGSDVEANPSGSATDTIEKIGIDGTVYSVEDADAVHTSDIGTANGVAELDSNGLVPSSQLPSYVDDVLEYASVSAFPATGETGKIYVALDTNLTYRWSGSAYVEISPSLALGETSSTAYRGDRGKTAYDHATESGRSGAKSAGLYKIGVTAQGHVASATAVAKADLTALGVADQNDVDAIEADIEGFKTVTGEYITINDAASLPAHSYSLTLSPVQDLNGYEYPWVGGGHYNKWNEEWELGALDETTGQPFPNNNVIRTKNYIPCQAETDYYYYCGAGDLAFRICYYDSSKNFISSLAMTSINRAYQTPQNCAFIKFGMRDTYGTTYNHDIAINYPSSVTTYSPYANICPIHGADEVGVRVRGFNQWDEEWELGSISSGNPSPDATRIRSKNFCPCFPSTAYYLGNTITGKPYYLFWYDENKTYINTTSSGDIRNSPSNAHFFKVCSAYSGDYTSYSGGWCINISKTTGTPKNGDYEPYTLHSTTITLPSTVYGGSVEQGGSGEKTYIMVEYDGSNDENWERFSSGSAGAYAMQIALSARMNYTSVSALPPILANYLRPISQAATWGNYDSFVSANTASEYLYTGIKGITTVADWRTFLSQNPLQVCYELATPTDITVTPFPQTLLEGVNNLWAEMKENSVVIDNAQQSLSYQPQNIVGQLRQEIEAKPDSFAELSDTSFSNLSNGQIPKWNSTSGKWENANESGGGGLPAWTKIWNYNSGATFSMPSGKTDIMLVIVLDASNTRLISNVYPVEYPFSKILNTEYFDGTDIVWMEITTSNVVNVGNNTQQPTNYFDFEIWVR